MATNTTTPAMWRTLAETDPEIAAVLRDERHRQNSGLELIASENAVSRAVLEAAGAADRVQGEPAAAGVEAHEALVGRAIDDGGPEEVDVESLQAANVRREQHHLGHAHEPALIPLLCRRVGVRWWGGRPCASLPARRDKPDLRR